MPLITLISVCRDKIDPDRENAVATGPAEPFASDETDWEEDCARCRPPPRKDAAPAIEPADVAGARIGRRGGCAT